MRRLSVAAAFVGLSVLAPAPSEAFWGQEKEPTYDVLLDNSYRISPKMHRKLYNSPGWILMKIYSDGRVDKMKLIDCRWPKCMYYWRIADVQDPIDQDVYVEEIDCLARKYRWKPMSAAPWTRWGTFINDRTHVAYRKFCKQ